MVSLFDNVGENDMISIFLASARFNRSKYISGAIVQILSYEHQVAGHTEEGASNILHHNNIINMIFVLSCCSCW